MNKPSPSRVANKYASTSQAAEYWRKLTSEERFDWLITWFGDRVGGRTLASDFEDDRTLQSVLNEIGETYNWRLSDKFAEAVQEEAANPTSEPEESTENLTLESVLQKYIESNQLTTGESIYLREAVSKSTVAPGIKYLERIQQDLPRWTEGSTVKFSIASFSSAEFSKGESAGQIVWKSSDKCIVRVEKPKRGLTVNYEGKQFGFPASAERETLLTGSYQVVKVKSITQPHTYEEYGYKTLLFVLKEA